MNDNPQELHTRRKELLGERFSTFYRRPVYLVRGEGVNVWDNEGRVYLDCYNNVPHVGHCHPKVVEAICHQSKTLNTHTRYLHHNIVEYAEELTALLDSSLNSLTMTCTGSEANDLALRIAQVATGHTGVICTNVTYHGNTTAVSQLSTSRPPIGGDAGNIVRISPPNELEPIGGDQGMSQAEFFARQVQDAIERLEAEKCGFGALILCPLFANEGFPTLERGFLQATVDLVRGHGGVIIADEVQSGFARTGVNFWAHDKLGFVPDILCLGKPIANGYPVGAVVCNDRRLNEFQTRYRYFNTFGGNPVACAAARATLQVLLEEKLQANARAVGIYARRQLTQVQARYPILANVRGCGLFFGVEIDRHQCPDGEGLTRTIVEAMKDNGVLIGVSGPYRTILKMRPPMPFSKSNVDQLVDTLAKVMKGCSDRRN